MFFVLHKNEETKKSRERQRQKIGMNLNKKYQSKKVILEQPLFHLFLIAWKDKGKGDFLWKHLKNRQYKLIVI